MIALALDGPVAQFQWSRYGRGKAVGGIMKKILCAAILLTGFTGTASARDWPDLQNWSFAQGKDYCEMWTTYGEQDDTRFSIALTSESAALIGIGSKSWNIEANKNYPILYSVKEGTVEESEVKGWVDGDYKGFITNADMNFVDGMMKEGFFALRIEAAAAQDNLDVSGSDQAYAQLKTCIAEVKKIPAQ
jgi:hypothetical protein